MNDGFHLTVQLYDTIEVANTIVSIAFINSPFLSIKATLPRHEVYLVSKERYKKSLHFITEKEQEWIGRVIIARSSKTGLFHPGMTLRP